MEVEYKVRASAEARAGDTYQRHFAPSQVADAKWLKKWLGTLRGIARWPPGDPNHDDLVDGLGFARHRDPSDRENQDRVFFSLQMSGIKGERKPPLRVFFYFHTTEPVVFVVHVAKESIVERDIEGVLTQAANNIKAHLARGGHS